MGASALPDKLVEELHTAPRRKRKKEKSVKDKTKGFYNLWPLISGLNFPPRVVKISMFFRPKAKKREERQKR